MRILVISIQSTESDFYGRVGTELASLGHEVAHVTYSRRSARRLRALGVDAWCLPDEMKDLPEEGPLADEVERIERRYDFASLRDVYRTDGPSGRKPEDWAVRRTVRHFQTLERIFDRFEPDVLLPEVGTELIRIAAHEVALERGIPVFFLFYTIFPHPLRLYVDTMHAPIVQPGDLRELESRERDEVETFISEFTARRSPIRAHRKVGPTLGRARKAAEYVGARLGQDRDNEYLRPGRWAFEHAVGWGRAVAARPLYRRLNPGRPFVYFPLHVTDDYKIKRVIPHCEDQASIIEQIADALPQGYDLAVKEHPLSIGRNSLSFLRRVQRRPNVRLLPPRTSTHDLIERSEAVAVISSTVGLEALLYAKPVLTVGSPFYAGCGVTLDVDSFAELRESVPALLRFRPDRERILQFLHASMRRCHPGAPVLVDSSEQNAVTLAERISLAASEVAAAPADERLLAAQLSSR